MQAYRSGFNDTDTRLLLSPDSQFFRFFGDAMGGATVTLPPAGSEPSGPDDTGAAGPGASDAGGSEPRANLPAPPPATGPAGGASQGVESAPSP
jgi:membrane protease subunit HflC